MFRTVDEPKMRLSLVDADAPAESGGGLHVAANGFKPSYRQGRKCETSGFLALTQVRDAVPEFGQPSFRDGAVCGFKRMVKLLAAALFKRIINS